MFFEVISRINVLCWIKNLLEDQWTREEEQEIKQAWLNVFAKSKYHVLSRKLTGK